MRITVEDFDNLGLKIVAEILEGIVATDTLEKAIKRKVSKDVWKINNLDVTTYLRKTQKGFALDIHKGFC